MSLIAIHLALSVKSHALQERNVLIVDRHVHKNIYIYSLGQFIGRL